ncbi:syntaxin 16 [Rhodnius prolixus]|uniref:syntaxin 16 n=1 Tax=Rhodnius prolixus TaxID=13249 RepID=UPI003D18AA7D
MASRSLTEIFILMRNNAVQNRNIYSEQMSSDRLALVAAVEDDEFELGSVPPAWSSIVEDCQYTIVRLKSKIAALNELQNKNILMPSFDDSKKTETHIKNMKEEIARMYNGLYKNIGQIYSECAHSKSSLEKRLVTSVAKALVSDIQNLYTEFKSIENNYANKMKTMHERCNKYFETVDLEETSEVNPNNFESADWTDSKQYRQQQLFLDDESLKEEKQSQVNQVLESVIELRDIYRDLSRLVVEQGTVLDRIDYNIEITSLKVKNATVSIEKAASYQQNNRKIYCILILSIVLITIIPVLIVIKV